MMMYRHGGVLLSRNFWTKMSDEEIAKLSIPEIAELIRRLLEEMVLRYMEVVN